jgi:hypothetical protein
MANGRGSNTGISLEAGKSYRAQEVLSEVPDSLAVRVGGWTWRVRLIPSYFEYSVLSKLW